MLHVPKDCLKGDSYVANFISARNSSEPNKMPLIYILSLPDFISDILLHGNFRMNSLKPVAIFQIEQYCNL
jgi:hypothetical protein